MDLYSLGKSDVPRIYANPYPPIRIELMKNL